MFCRARVLLKPATSGTGIIAGVEHRVAGVARSYG